MPCAEPTGWIVRGAADGEVAVVGASGFLGRAVAAELARQGRRARLLARGRGEAGAPAACALEDALTGCRSVINCVGRAHVAGREEAEVAQERFFATNCDLAAQIGRSSRAAGVRRFVHVSSVAALCSTSPSGRTIDDQAVPRPDNLYGRSKLAGDERILELASDGFRPAVLRPPAIYGPGAKGWFPVFLRAARAGVPLPLASIRNRRSFAYAGNIASAVVHAAGRDDTGAWIVTDSPPMSTAAFYALALRAAGRSNRVFAVPERIMVPLVRLAAGARADSLIGDAAYDGSRFLREMRWEPRWSPAEGMAHTMDPGASPQAAGHTSG